MTLGSIRYLPSSSPSWQHSTDVVVVGAGAAGLSAALDASRRGHRVVVLAKLRLEGGSTLFAQGGLAAVMDGADTLASHIDDTLVAAAGLADLGAVHELVAAAPGAVRYLADLGARFDEGPLGLEGGHSHRRIVHAGGDAIGSELHRVLREAVLRSDVEILERTVAIDVVRDDAGVVVGILAGRIRPTKDLALETGFIEARAVVLATGGLGQAFSSSTNPAEVTGDGIALAARAGAVITNVEFVQFHPTVLFRAGRLGQSPLITEAMRGAGATIVDDQGTPVMRGRHVRGDLAPRDVVSYSMFERMHAEGETLEHLWLDARALGATRLRREFPTTLELCRLEGVDPVHQLIPIAPGAHYSCGGVRADLDGTTTVPGLYAIGETAATGVHGANRLASNSLTEAVISGRRLARRLDEMLSARPERQKTGDTSAPACGHGVDGSTREAMATSMSKHVGVVRERRGLESVVETLDRAPHGKTATLDLGTVEATNLHTVSFFVASAALLREESRGCHRRSDFPDASVEWTHSIALHVVDQEIVECAEIMAGA